MKTKEDIKQLIEKENVEFIRLQFTDMYGTLKTGLLSTAENFLVIWI